VDLAILGDVVLDAEVVVATQGGRADFDLLGARMYGKRDTPPAYFYVFDVLRVGDAGLVDRSWTERRKWPDEQLAEATGGKCEGDDLE